MSTAANLGAIELNRETPLFDNTFPITIVSGANNDRTVPLSVRIIPGTRASTTGGNNERLLHFEVTDDNDPFFLYLLDVGENDFHHLKREQALLVEFSVFPQKFIELIELCLNSNVISSDTNVSQFLGKMDTSTGVFSIVEANMFKQLTHISLNLRQGNDAAIKTYLASRFFLISSISRKQQQKIDQMQDQLTAELTLRRDMANELQELRTHRDQDINTIETSHSTQIAQIQMQNLEQLEQVRQRFDAQMDAMRICLETDQRELLTTKTNSEQEIARLNSSNTTLEYKVKDLSHHLALAEEERDKYQHENQEYSTVRKSLEESNTVLERDLTRAQTKIEGLTEQLSDKDEIIAKSVALQKASEEAKDNMEEKLQTYITNNEILQEKLRLTAAEITKGNQVIARLQADGKQLKEKTKMKSEVIRRQENLVTELRGKITDLESKLSASGDNISSQKLHMTSLQRQLDDANERINESTKLIASNQEVITYLNEEINKWQLGMRSQTQVNINSVSPETTKSSTNMSSYRTALLATDLSRNSVSSPEWEKDIGLNEKDIYLKGIQNLGLADSFGGLEGLGFDGDIGFDLKSLDYYAPASSLGSSKAHSLRAYE